MRRLEIRLGLAALGFLAMAGGWMEYRTLMAQVPPGGPPRFGGGPGQGPENFGPGMFIAPRILELADTNGDGRLTREEAANAVAKLISEADKKNEGGLDQAGLGRAINRKFGPPTPDGTPPPDDEAADFGPGMFWAEPILARFDTDKNGRVSPEEASKGLEKLFEEEKIVAALDTEGLARKINQRLGGPGGPGGGPGGPGQGPGGGFGMGQIREIVKDHDKDGDGRLNQEERRLAWEAMKSAPRRRFGPRGRGNPNEPKPSPGPRISPAEVEVYPDAPLYDPSVVRTLFLDFEDKDWESEMAAFNDTDVEMPATLTVDGKTYPGVGVHFRGASSFMMVPEGSKRSLNVSLDYTDSKQRLAGYKTLNLLNSHEDPTFLHTILYHDVASRYLPAPKANFVRVVINGESWGVYVNVQQFDKIFLTENFKNGKGARWKVKGNPGGGGGLAYLGDDPSAYKNRYSIKTKDREKDWAAFVELCKVLNQTPPDKLEAALDPILDIDGTLRFLALDNALINNDGYWIRASDYSIYRDPAGKFHLLPHDMNESFGAPGGPGFGGPGRGGPGRGAAGAAPANPFALDPLIGLNEEQKPLRSKLLAVPALRDRYLRYVHQIATESLDWDWLGPIVARNRALIEKHLEADTRKLTSFAEFEELTGETDPEIRGGGGFGPPPVSIHKFATERRTYLLNNPDVKKAVEVAK